MMKTADDILNDKGSAVYSVSIEATIADAIALMVDKRIGAVLVEQDGKMVGIWTERDLLRSSLSGDFDPQTARIADHMTFNLITVPHTESMYRLMDKFLGLRLRHLPVEKEGKIIGLLSSGDVIKTALVEKTREFDELNKMVSWEYYENWRWKK
jgi:CBS domain-containing protein